MGIQTFRLPDLGEGLTEAEIVRWLVAEGEDVRVDQPVVEVETAKSVVELPTPFAGRISRRYGREGQTIAVGSPLIAVESADVAVAAAVAKPSRAGEFAETYREEERGGSGNVLVGYGTSGTPTGGRRRRPRVPVAAATRTSEGVRSAERTVRREAPRVVSPLVRQLARTRGIDISDLHGTGLGGLITRADVERAATGERRTPLNGFRKAAAASFARSRSEIPEATIWVDVDATGLVERRERGRTADSPGPGLLAYLARFVVDALVEYPMFNGRFDTARQEIVECADVNLGIAVQGARGLLVPAIAAAQSLTVDQLDEQVNRLVERAHQGKLTAAELSSGTFTLNNYGPLGVDGSAAIINHPQVAILGIGRILDRPWVSEGQLVVRKIAQLSFVFDHRVGDGVTAAGFVRRVADAIEAPVDKPE
jgi:pyruvate dehydrogenase E2 component (dihydrolipoamide acetyltransferase)